MEGSWMEGAWMEGDVWMEAGRGRVQGGGRGGDVLTKDSWIKDVWMEGGPCTEMVGLHQGFACIEAGGWRRLDGGA